MTKEEAQELDSESVLSGSRILSLPAVRFSTAAADRGPDRQRAENYGPTRRLATFSRRSETISQAVMFALKQFRL